MNRQRAMSETALEVQEEYVANETVTAITDTTSYFLLCEHPPVYTLGKSGKMENKRKIPCNHNVSFIDQDRQLSGGSGAVGSGRTVQPSGKKHDVQPS